MINFKLISFKKNDITTIQKACNYFDFDPSQCTIDICVLSDSEDTACIVDFCIHDNGQGSCWIDSCGMNDATDPNNSCFIDDCGVDTGCGLDNDDDGSCILYDYGCPQDKVK